MVVNTVRWVRHPGKNRYLYNILDYCMFILQGVLALKNPQWPRKCYSSTWMRWLYIFNCLYFRCSLDMLYLFLIAYQYGMMLICLNLLVPCCIFRVISHSSYIARQGKMESPPFRVDLPVRHAGGWRLGTYWNHHFCSCFFFSGGRVFIHSLKRT